MNAIKTQKSQSARTRFDIATKMLARLRGALVPEQQLVGHGNQSIKISNTLEVYFIETVGMP